MRTTIAILAALLATSAEARPLRRYGPRPPPCFNCQIPVQTPRAAPHIPRPATLTPQGHYSGQNGGASRTGGVND